MVSRVDSPDSVEPVHQPVYVTRNWLLSVSIVTLAVTVRYYILQRCKVPSAFALTVEWVVLSLSFSLSLFLSPTKKKQ